MSQDIKELKKKFLIQGVNGKLSSQQLFVSMSDVNDLLIHGGRGGGKTETLINDVLSRFFSNRDIELNFCFLRNVYGALGDSVKKLRDTARKFLDEDDYKFYYKDGYTVFILLKDSKKKYQNNDEIEGSRLYFRAAKSVKDYEDKFHGSNFDGIYIDELSTFCPKLASMLKDTLRSSKGNTPVFRAATNPWGLYTKEVYDEYILDKEDGVIYKTKTNVDYINPVTGKKEVKTIEISKGSIKSYLQENYFLEPDYLVNLINDYMHNERLLKAYVYGDFDFTDSRFLHIDRSVLSVKPFQIPRSWASTAYISYDDGTSSPFSALWFIKATSNSYMNHKGEDIRVPVGSLFVINEFYGSEAFLNMRNNNNRDFVITPEFDDLIPVGLNLTHSEIAKLIKDENNGSVKAMLGGYIAKCGPADTSIKKNDRGNGGKTVYDIFKDNGLDWQSAIKGNNSRVDNANVFKNMLKATYDGDMTQPHIYFFSGKTDMLLYNLENLKSNPNNPDDILDNNRDHDWDALRYGITHSKRASGRVINRNGW